MKINHFAKAGTLESSDVFVTVEPTEGANSISIESSVFEQYGESILQSTLDVLENLGVECASVKIQDQGALDCTIRARVETAILRSVDITEHIEWGVTIK